MSHTLRPTGFNANSLIFFFSWIAAVCFWNFLADHVQISPANNRLQHYYLSLESGATQTASASAIGWELLLSKGITVRVTTSDTCAWRTNGQSCEPTGHRKATSPEGTAPPRQLRVPPTLTGECSILQPWWAGQGEAGARVYTSQA